MDKDTPTENLVFTQLKSDIAKITDTYKKVGEMSEKPETDGWTIAGNVFQAIIPLVIELITAVMSGKDPLEYLENERVGRLLDEKSKIELIMIAQKLKYAPPQ